MFAPYDCLEIHGLARVFVAIRILEYVRRGSMYESDHLSSPPREDMRILQPCDRMLDEVSEHM